jgi:hypothetical protein
MYLKISQKHSAILPSIAAFLFISLLLFSSLPSETDAQFYNPWLYGGYGGYGGGLYGLYGYGWGLFFLIELH